MAKYYEYEIQLDGVQGMELLTAFRNIPNGYVREMVTGLFGYIQVDVGEGRVAQGNWVMGELMSITAQNEEDARRAEQLFKGL